MTISITPPFGALTVLSTPHSRAIPSTHHSRRAVVIGAGMGGLTAARVLANHFDDVVVVERDTLPAPGVHRKGVPQGHHVHGLLAQGCTTLERLFPGILDELSAHGALIGDAMGAIRWHQSGGYHASGQLGVRAVSASRPLIEGVLRKRLLELPNVRLLDATVVDDLAWDAGRNRVVGVRLSGASGTSDGTLPAGVVIDASGRGSRLPAWLHDAEYDRPTESSLDIGIRYASRMFRRTPGQMGGKLIVAAISSPQLPRGGLATAVEEDRWLVTLAGRLGIQPPTDRDAFEAYAKSLGAPDIHDLIRDSEPLDDGITYAFPRSLRRHYEGLNRFPAGVIPIADAICGFNPIYGQGMTVAALEAEVLDECLAEGTGDLPMRFLTAVTPLVDGAWKLATSGDLRFVAPAHSLPRKIRFLNWYLERLHIAARRDPGVARGFCKVMHLLEPPTSLLKPAIALRVLARGGGGRPHESDPTSRVPTAAREPVAGHRA